MGEDCLFDRSYANHRADSNQWGTSGRTGTAAWAKFQHWWSANVIKISRKQRAHKYWLSQTKQALCREAACTPRWNGSGNVPWRGPDFDLPPAPPDVSDPLLMIRNCSCLWRQMVAGGLSVKTVFPLLWWETWQQQSAFHKAKNAFYTEVIETDVPRLGVMWLCSVCGGISVSERWRVAPVLTVMWIWMVLLSS